jgi:hypothetical protein
MNRPQLNKLPKHLLVELHRKVIGAPGDYARNPKEHYVDALEARGSAELSDALATIERKPRKASQRSIDKKNALANAREFHAIARALVSWGDDLANNPEAIRTLQARAKKALG